jgi:streptogramin lyase
MRLQAALALSLLALAPSAEGQPGRLVPLQNAEALAFGAGSVWATGPRVLLRIDPATESVVARIPLPALAGSIAVADRRVWVVTNPIHTSASTTEPSLLWSIDTARNRFVGTPIPLSPMASAGGLVFAQGSLWVTNDQHGRFGRLDRIDPKTRRIIARIPIPNDPTSLVSANGSLWVGESDTGKVVRVDPKSGAIEGRPISVGGALLTLAAGDGTIWVANNYSGRLAVIDARTARLIANRPLPGIDRIAASAKTVWATFGRTGRLAGFDRMARQTHPPLEIRGGADGVVASANQLWVINALGISSISTL